MNVFLFSGGLDLPALSPIPQSPASPASASTTPSSIEATSPITSKTKPVAQQRVQIADLPKLETEPKLEHLGKDRYGCSRLLHWWLVKAGYTNDLFVLPDPDSDTDSDLNFKPDAYIVLCRACSQWTDLCLDSDPDSDPKALLYPFLGLISVPKSVSESVSGNVNKPAVNDWFGASASILASYLIMTEATHLVY